MTRAETKDECKEDEYNLVAAGQVVLGNHRSCSNLPMSGMHLQFLEVLNNGTPSWNTSMTTSNAFLRSPFAGWN
jgi:hypothetical protein